MNEHDWKLITNEENQINEIFFLIFIFGLLFSPIEIKNQSANKQINTETVVLLSE